MWATPSPGAPGHSVVAYRMRPTLLQEPSGGARRGATKPALSSRTGSSRTCMRLVHHNWIAGLTHASTSLSRNTLDTLSLRILSSIFAWNRDDHHAASDAIAHRPLHGASSAAEADSVSDLSPMRLLVATG